MRPKSANPWHLKLYVSGDEAAMEKTVAALRQVCSDHLEGNCEMEIIDIRKNPAAAVQDDIIATPSLLRKFPTPVRRIVGDLTNKDQVRIALEIDAVEPENI